jgi:hypothetical protein
MNDPRQPTVAAIRRRQRARHHMGVVHSRLVVIAMMVYGHNRPVSSAGNPHATDSSTTTGAAPPFAIELPRRRCASSPDATGEVSAGPVEAGDKTQRDRRAVSRGRSSDQLP